MTLENEENIATIVRGSIKLSNDFEKLKHIAKTFAPEDYSINRYQEDKVNMYLDLYNSCMHTSRLNYEGEGEFTVKGRPPLYCRQLALWSTYLSIVEDAGIDTEGWTYNPGQKRLDTA